METIASVLMVAGAAIALFLVNRKSYYGFLVFILVVEPMYLITAYWAGSWGLAVTETLYISLYLQGLIKWYKEAQ